MKTGEKILKYGFIAVILAIGVYKYAEVNPKYSTDKNPYTATVESKNKNFKVYKENNNGEYVLDPSSTLPASGYILNTTRSQCLDGNDNVVNANLSFSNGKISLTSNKTVYCTLYFDRRPAPTAPTITASDSIASGNTHTSAVTLTFSGSTLTGGTVDYYYGTSSDSITTQGTSVTVSQSTETTYYVKACDSTDSTNCSSVVSYNLVIDIRVYYGWNGNVTSPTAQGADIYNYGVVLASDANHLYDFDWTRVIPITGYNTSCGTYGFDGYYCSTGGQNGAMCIIERGNVRCED